MYPSARIFDISLPGAAQFMAVLALSGCIATSTPAPHPAPMSGYLDQPSPEGRLPILKPDPSFNLVTPPV
ncbi:MAG: hypothetical protein HQL36_06795, partial [Alphaproteobacteria bacterium]|nr:hypothetical protein [Alphaproteobacteria bacterium]